MNTKGFFSVTNLALILLCSFPAYADKSCKTTLGEGCLQADPGFRSRLEGFKSSPVCAESSPTQEFLDLGSPWSRDVPESYVQNAEKTGVQVAILSEGLSDQGITLDLVVGKIVRVPFSVFIRDGLLTRDYFVIQPKGTSKETDQVSIHLSNILAFAQKSNAGLPLAYAIERPVVRPSETDITPYPSIQRVSGPQILGRQ